MSDSQAVLMLAAALLPFLAMVTANPLSRQVSSNPIAGFVVSISAYPSLEPC